MIKCENCAFYEENKCRRYPPHAVSESYAEDYLSSVFFFPDVEEDDWCGEFRQKWTPIEDKIIVYIKN